MPEPTELPIVQYWHEKNAPDYIVELFDSVREFNPGARQLIFSNESAEDFISEHFGDREVSAFRACAVPAMQADYFRCCAGLALGGVYLDADLRCVGSMQPLVPGEGEGRLFRGTGGNVINGIFAFGSSGHRFLELVLEIATSNIARRFPDTAYRVAGPPVFACLAAIRRLGSIESVLSQVTGSPDEKAIRAYCEVIGKPARVTRAFEGVEIAAESGLPPCVTSVDGLPHKRSDMHWANFKGPIFR